MLAVIVVTLPTEQETRRWEAIVNQSHQRTLTDHDKKSSMGTNGEEVTHLLLKSGK